MYLNLTDRIFLVMKKVFFNYFSRYNVNSKFISVLLFIRGYGNYDGHGFNVIENNSMKQIVSVCRN